MEETIIIDFASSMPAVSMFAKHRWTVWSMLTIKNPITWPGECHTIRILYAPYQESRTKYMTMWRFNANESIIIFFIDKKCSLRKVCWKIWEKQTTQTLKHDIATTSPSTAQHCIHASMGRTILSISSTDTGVPLGTAITVPLNEQYISTPGVVALLAASDHVMTSAYLVLRSVPI